MSSPHRIGRSLVFLVGVSLLPPALWGQDSNILQPIDQVEELFKSADFEIIASTGSRFEGDRTSSATLQFADGTMIRAKWAPAPRGGGEFNNRPRYELAAYEAQKLFLEGPEYVVPPTAARCVPLDFYRTLDPNMQPTWDQWFMVLVVLQYWLWNVEPSGRDANKFLDKDRFDEDEAYATHMANFNILTYLIHHGDSNEGNFMASVDPENPRIFAVDNGISFMYEESNRGTFFRDLQVESLPRTTVERLRGVTLEDVQAALGTVAQFDVISGALVNVDPGDDMDPGKGIRREGNILQLGLTEREVRNIHRRITDLLKWVDEGRYELF